MDARTLAYDHDEEALGFGEPETPEGVEPRRPGAGARFALALVALGLLSLVLQWSGGPLAGTWLGLSTSFGLIAVGGALHFWLALRGTHPGIKHDGIMFRSLLAQGALGWVAGVLFTGFYVVLYWFPEYLGYQPPVYGAEGVVEEGRVTGGMVAVVDPLARALTGQPASQWFLYGVLYTLAILVFGVWMWMKYRHSRYHKIRTASVAFFQLVAAFLLPQLLVRFRHPYMEFNGVWPLKFDYLWPDKVSSFANAGFLGGFLLLWALILALVATPVLTYFYGKRWYCSWVCGCGGLAETLGDPWRQLSDKSTRAWKIERWLIHSVLAAVVLVTLVLWGNGLLGGSLLGSWAHPAKQWYGFYVGAIFAGVIGVGFYPLLGSRVWCRFGCPQAAILGILQRSFSRFRITTNGGQCMSCGNCSTYCEMGIDVRAYAQRNENIVRASCVGCGVCAAVCPRGVLRLENGPRAGRFEHSDEPVRVFVENFREPDPYGYEPWK